MYDVEMPSELSAILAVMEITVNLGLGDLASPLSCMGADGFEGTLLFWTIAPFCVVVVWTLVVAAVHKARRFRTRASAGQKKKLMPTRLRTGELRQDTPRVGCIWSDMGSPFCIVDPQATMPWRSLKTPRRGPFACSSSHTRECKSD